MDYTKVPHLFYIFFFNRIRNITIVYISIDTQTHTKEEKCAIKI